MSRLSHRPQDSSPEAGIEAGIDAAAEWFARRDEGPLSPAEEAAFARWLEIDPGHRAAYAAIEGAWAAFDAVPADLAPRAVSAAATARPTPAARPARPVARYRPVRRAAAAAIAAGLLVAVFLGSGLPDRLAADAATGIGETLSLALPDGSTVLLNTDTAIAYDFDGRERRLRLLRGEAAFEVAGDPERPFRVEAAGGSGTALGTVYAMRLTDGGAAVTVAEGRVAVAAGPGPAAGQAVLAAGQQVSYGPGSGLGPVTAVDTRMAMAWRRGKLVFEGRPLGEVIDELNRYHSGAIRILDGGLRDRPVNGVFETGDPVAAIDVLEQSLGLTSTRLTDWLILLHR